MGHNDNKGAVIGLTDRKLLMRPLRRKEDSMVVPPLGCTRLTIILMHGKRAWTRVMSSRSLGSKLASLVSFIPRRGVPVNMTLKRSLKCCVRETSVDRGSCSVPMGCSKPWPRDDECQRKSKRWLSRVSWSKITSRSCKSFGTDAFGDGRVYRVSPRRFPSTT